MASDQKDRNNDGSDQALAAAPAFVAECSGAHRHFVTMTSGGVLVIS